MPSIVPSTNPRHRRPRPETGAFGGRPKPDFHCRPIQPIRFLRSRFRWILIGLAVLLVSPQLVAILGAQTTEPAKGARQGAPEASLEATILVDRLVALVDEDPIFLSDLRRALALGFVADGEPDDVASDDVLRLERQERRVLDRLIEERLRLHEVDRYEIAAVSETEIDRQVALVEASAGGAEELDRQLQGLGLEPSGLRSLLRRQVRVLAYVEERLGARVFIDEEEIRAHHAGPLAQQMAELGEPLPPLQEVRDPIRVLLRELALDREVAQWTDRLRQEADIVDLLGQALERADWPSVVLYLDEADSTEGLERPEDGDQQGGEDPEDDL